MLKITNKIEKRAINIQILIKNPLLLSLPSEYAVSFSDRIALYDSQWNEVDRVVLDFKGISSMIYDEIQDRIYIADMLAKDNGRMYALSRDPSSQKYVTTESLASKIHEEERIRGIAFDPVDRHLYWIDETLRRIYKLDLKQPRAEPVILFAFDHEKPQAISVDACRRYLYWTTDNDNVTTIERATLQGEKRQVLIKERLQQPVALEIDQFSDRMFWIDNHPGTEVLVESADLHGGDRTLIYAGHMHELRSLIVDEDRMFIVDFASDCVFALNKTANSTMEKLKVFDKAPRGIIKRPHFVERHRGDPICERTVASLEKQMREIEEERKVEGGKENKVRQPTPPTAICLNGILTKGGHCNCSDGWTGTKCETKLCHNYCFHGKCAVARNGFPVCHCDKGFTGERCEVNRCAAYCLNDGRCELDGDQPVCQCPPAFSGRHCEVINSRPVICRAFCEIGLDLPNIDWSLEDECR